MRPKLPLSNLLNGISTENTCHQTKPSDIIVWPADETMINQFEKNIAHYEQCHGDLSPSEALTPERPLSLTKSIVCWWTTVREWQHWISAALTFIRIPCHCSGHWRLSRNGRLHELFHRLRYVPFSLPITVNLGGYSRCSSA